MDLYEALSILQEAANNWAEYLEENAREDEVEPIDVANDAVDAFKKTLGVKP